MSGKGESASEARLHDIDRVADLHNPHGCGGAIAGRPYCRSVKHSVATKLRLRAVGLSVPLYASVPVCVGFSVPVCVDISVPLGGRRDDVY